MMYEHISDDIPPQMKKFEYGYPHSNALLQSRLKLFPQVYHRIDLHKFLTLSNKNVALQKQVD